MSDKLIEMKNIGNTSAHWLVTVGINTPEKLREVGPIEAYRRIQNRGIKTSKVLLYALYGALENQYWNEIPEATKIKLNEEASQKEPSLSD